MPAKPLSLRAPEPAAGRSLRPGAGTGAGTLLGKVGRERLRPSWEETGLRDGSAHFILHLTPSGALGTSRGAGGTLT